MRRRRTDDGNAAPRPRLREAYMNTTYRVIAVPRPIDIRIDQTNVALEQLLLDHGVSEWAFVTASNPQSRALSDEENRRRNDELKNTLRAQRWRYVDAAGVPDRGGWPPETSVLILGMGRPAAQVLARRWGQAAIVCGRLGGVAELVWVDAV